MLENEHDAAPPRWMLITFAIVILVPCLYGFAGKFYEFIHIFRGDASGVFAITPIVNYLLASLGFACLLGWAASNGMFHDVESTKFKLLENERLLDASDHRSSSV